MALRELIYIKVAYQRKREQLDFSIVLLLSGDGLSRLEQELGLERLQNWETLRGEISTPYFSGALVVCSSPEPWSQWQLRLVTPCSGAERGISALSSPRAPAACLLSAPAPVRSCS